MVRRRGKERRQKKCRFDRHIAIWHSAFTRPLIQSHSSPIHIHESPIEAPSAVVLLLLMIYFAAVDIKDRFAGNAQPVDHSAPRLDLSVSGMTCGGCVRKVENVLRSETGVDAVEVTLEPGSAVVYGQTEKDQLIKAIESVGFSAK